MKRLILVVLGLLPILPVAAGAQANMASFPQVENGKLIGVVSSDHSLGPLLVSIAKVGATAVLATQELNDKGGFEFSAVAPGEYTVNVTNSNHCIEYRATVRIKPGKVKKVGIGRARRIRPDLCE